MSSIYVPTNDDLIDGQLASLGAERISDDFQDSVQSVLLANAEATAGRTTTEVLDPPPSWENMMIKRHERRLTQHEQIMGALAVSVNGVVKDIATLNTDLDTAFGAIDALGDFSAQLAAAVIANASGIHAVQEQIDTAAEIANVQAWNDGISGGLSAVLGFADVIPVLGPIVTGIAETSIHAISTAVSAIHGAELAASMSLSADRANASIDLAMELGVAVGGSVLEHPYFRERIKSETVEHLMRARALMDAVGNNTRLATSAHYSVLLSNLGNLPLFSANLATRLSDETLRTNMGHLPTHAYIIVRIPEIRYDEDIDEGVVPTTVYDPVTKKGQVTGYYWNFAINVGQGAGVSDIVDSVDFARLLEGKSVLDNFVSWGVFHQKPTTPIGSLGDLVDGNIDVDGFSKYERYVAYEGPCNVAPDMLWAYVACAGEHVPGYDLGFRNCQHTSREFANFCENNQFPSWFTDDCKTEMLAKLLTTTAGPAYGPEVGGIGGDEPDQNTHYTSTYSTLGLDAQADALLLLLDS